jgi:hypothetical protein
VLHVTAELVYSADNAMQADLGAPANHGEFFLQDVLQVKFHQSEPLPKIIVQLARNTLALLFLDLNEMTA